MIFTYVYTLFNLLVMNQPSFKRIIENFPQSRFDPPRGLLSPITRNNHFQTIVGSGALYSRFFPIVRNFQTVEERFTTEDGDFFDIEYTDNFESSDRVVIILHGLESSSKGPMVTRMAHTYIEKGFGCVLVCFRGCNGEDNKLPGAYHVGFTTDIRQVTTTIHSRHPTKRFYLSGFSLGGNVALKYLGELGEDAMKLNIFGGTAFCVPFDAEACQPKLDSGISRAIYSENFLRTLKKKAEEKIQSHPGAFDIEAVRRCNTIGDFDDAFIAPIYGFKDKVDYYKKSDSKRFLHRIRVPTLVINAVDDPFVEERTLPTTDDVGDAPVRLHYEPFGGHCGFKPHTVKSPNGWVAEEIARALAYVDDCLLKEGLISKTGAVIETQGSAETVSVGNK